MNNSLKAHAHLFSNGEFKAKVNDVIYEIIGIHKARDGELFAHLYNEKGYYQHIDDFDLIARPIEDMTDEETQSYPMVEGFTKRSIEECKVIRKYIKEDIEMEALNSNCLLYLLSIGVYPFDQSHFEDGTVIDSTTL